MPPNDRSRPENGAATDRSSGLADLAPAYGSTLEVAIENAAGDWWSQGVMLAVKQLAAGGRGFTVDHVLDMVGQPTDCHYMGVVFASAQRQGIVEAVGCRVGRDGRLLRIWWGVAR